MTSIQHDELAAAAIAVLRDAYPRQPFPDAAVAFYARKLRDIPAEELAGAVDRLTSRMPFLPSVAEIRRDVAEARLNLPNVAEAWEIAERGKLRHAPQPVRDAAEFVGGRWAILHSDNITTVRAQFREQYNHLREQALLREQGALPPLPPARGELPPGLDYDAGPVMLRAVRELIGQPIDMPPTEEEMRDAITILKRGPWAGKLATPGADDHLYRAAERVLVDADNHARGQEATT